MIFKIIKFLHILAATVWVGGIIITVILNRYLRKHMELNTAIKTLSFLGKSLKIPMRISLLFAILTGIVMLYFWKIPLFDKIFYETTLGVLILVKVGVVAFILLMIPFHSTLEKSLVNETNEILFKKTRKKLLIVGWLIFLLSLLAMYLGTNIRYIL